MLSRLGSVISTMPCSYFFKHVFNVARHFVQQGGFLYSHNSDIPAEHVCFGVDEYLWVLNCFLCWKGVWTERWDLMILATISSCWNSSACFYRFAGTERRNTSRSFAKLYSMYCINTARNDLVNSTTCVSFVVVLQPRLWHATQSLETSVRGPHVTGEVATCCFWKILKHKCYKIHGMSHFVFICYTSLTCVQCILPLKYIFQCKGTSVLLDV